MFLVLVFAEWYNVQIYNNFLLWNFISFLKGEVLRLQYEFISEICVEIKEKIISYRHLKICKTELLYIIELVNTTWYNLNREKLTFTMQIDFLKPCRNIIKCLYKHLFRRRKKYINMSKIELQISSKYVNSDSKSSSKSKLELINH